MSFLSPFECDQSLGVLWQWPDVPVLLVLDSIPPLRQIRLFQQASMHGPGTWILRQQVGGEGEQDLTELCNMQAQMYAELPKKSRGLHREGCWERASWDVFPTRNTTQLWRCGPYAVPVPGPMASAPSPDEVQSYLELWVNMRYASIEDKDWPHLR